LDSIDRLSVRDYEPTDEDVLRARLRTLDIQEHELIVDDGERSVRLFALVSKSILAETDAPKWKIFDVGGSRTQVRVSPIFQFMLIANDVC
jgi:guanine nucleotide-binding protein subunit alpha